MPISVRLIRESGEQLRAVVDEGGLIDRAAAESDSRLLRYIDLYGDTYFNKLQMADFLADWDNTRGSIKSAADGLCWSKVKSFAEECAARTHLYLQFVGD